MNTAPAVRTVTFTLRGPFYIDTFSLQVPPYVSAQAHQPGQELWRAATLGDPLLAVNDSVLSSDGVVRAISDGRVLLDIGAPVARSAGDPVSDGTSLWIPRASASGVVQGVDVWDMAGGQEVGSVADPSRFSGLRQLTATSRGTVVGEDGASLVELDVQADVLWSCPTPGVPLYAPGPAGAPPAPLLERGTFVRVAELPGLGRAPGAEVSQRWVLQGFWLPGLEPAPHGWVTARRNDARTSAPR